MSRKEKGIEENPRWRKRGRRTFGLLLLTGSALVGWYIGFNLPEEKKNRANKLIREAREMPFRLFV